MLNKIISYSLHNRLLILFAAILLFFIGSYTAMKMEVDVFPDLNAPTVVIMTEAPGMAPEEVERLVTFPVETAVNGATDVRRVRSSSTTGFSVVWVEFNWGTDIYRARQITSEKLAVMSESLPANVGTPTLGPQSSILGEVMILGITSDSTSLQDLRTLADWVIRPRLLSTGGVAQVTVIGGEIKEYQILLDPARMKHYGIGLNEIMNTTRNMNQNANGGILYEFSNEYIVRGVVSTNHIDELSKAVVKTINGIPVLLEDIADIQIGNKAPKLGMASEKGKPAVLITVTKQPNTSTLELTAAADRALKSIFTSGFGYKKAGVVLGEIVPRGAVQTSLFDPMDRGRQARLMEMLDQVNERFGRHTLVTAAQGFDPLRSNRNHVSPNYTTSWDELFEVKV